MIVNYTEEGWQVITQRSHGILAAQVAAQWKRSHQPARWMETLLAIAEHDDAEAELDGENLLTATGGPLNFSMKKFELAHCNKLAMLTQTKSRYIALLTSMHMDFLYRGEEKESAEVKTFLKAQRALQEAWRKELELTKDEVEKTYSLLEWCDALSLLLCQGAVQPERRAVEVSTGPDDERYYLFATAANAITIEPWPFEATPFTVYFESRMLTQLQYKNNAEFRQAFLNSPVTETAWTFRKKPKGHKEPAKTI